MNRHVFALLILLVGGTHLTACSGAPTRAEGQTPEVPASQVSTCDAAPEPHDAAMQWVERGFRDAGELTKGWTQAHLIRLWKQGDRWQALVAKEYPADSGPVLRLVLARAGEGWTVATVSRDQATRLWPTF